MKYSNKEIESHNLSIQEYKTIVKVIGREPNFLELGIFSVMWSEHCSYKSTKKWLKTLPTKADWVICGPGENAGVIDIGNNNAIVFKMESHNHPSFIEPYQGAATGVGGIMRDIFTMGARPIANLNSLRFGNISHSKTKYLVNGVVSGIGDYGNCVGIPTVGGECFFHECYNNNILVNAMSIGLVKKNKIFFSAAKGNNYPIFYVGAKTGRDGIHGATMASAEFNENSVNNRPQVQVGDPFTEKLLMEACLELMKTKAIVAIQDMGAAGLTSSSFEMASKGNMGIILDLDQVPLREQGMNPYEIMLSETQERMLVIINPNHTQKTKQIFKKWGLDSVKIGSLTNDGKMKIFFKGKLQCSLQINQLVELSPEYNRPSKKKNYVTFKKKFFTHIKPLNALKKILASANFSSKKKLYSQYDQTVMGDTVLGPGDADAAVIRIHNTNKAIAATSDCNSIFCKADPYKGSMIAVAETWRNLNAVGAKPLAITDNLNFGNPEKKEIMYEIKQSIKGIKDACTYLDYPVVSGNVSLYNETNGKSIYPTPVIGGVGIIDNVKKIASIKLVNNCAVFLIGKTTGHLDLSLFEKVVNNSEKGKPPKLNLEYEKLNGEFVRNLIEKYNKEIIGVHDLSDGGLLLALAEMVMINKIGISIEIPKNIKSINHWLFGEDQSRYIVITKNAKLIEDLGKRNNIFIKNIGYTGGKKLIVKNFFEILYKELMDLNSKCFSEVFS